MTIESRAYFLGIVPVPFTKHEEKPSTKVRGATAATQKGAFVVDTPDVVYFAPMRRPQALQKLFRSRINRDNLRGPMQRGIQRLYTWKQTPKSK